MKITIILPSLEIGGAEQLTVNLINEWIEKKIEIELILLSNKGSLSKKIINKNMISKNRGKIVIKEIFLFMMAK